MAQLSDAFILSNGIPIPCIGFGTWQIPNGKATIDAVNNALQVGYRHIDTAAFYENEEGVGKAVRASGIAREEIFVTSKLWNTQRGYKKTMAAFDKTLKTLHLDYLDLYLIHWPATFHQYKNWKELNLETWRAFEAIYATGKVRAIGVSNFTVNHLDPLMREADIMPMVNQIEIHPGMRQGKTVRFCRDLQIVVEAWAPLGRGQILANPQLCAIAAKYGKSVAQICLRWCLQHDCLPLPKSVNNSRIIENTDVFDFMLSDDDLSEIDSIPYCGGLGLDPDNVDF